MRSISNKERKQPRVRSASKNKHACWFDELHALPHKWSKDIHPACTMPLCFCASGSNASGVNVKFYNECTTKEVWHPALHEPPQAGHHRELPSSSSSSKAAGQLRVVHCSIYSPWTYFQQLASQSEAMLACIQDRLRR